MTARGLEVGLILLAVTLVVGMFMAAGEITWRRRTSRKRRGGTVDVSTFGRDFQNVPGLRDERK